MHAAVILDQAPIDDVLLSPYVVDLRGLPVSLCGFLQNLHIQSLFGYQLFQATVLFLERLKLLGQLWIHTAILLTPAGVGLHVDFQQSTDFGDILSLP